MSKAILAAIIDKAKDEIVDKYADNMVEHVPVSYTHLPLPTTPYV